MSDVQAVLDGLYASRSVQNRNNDPVSFCHRYQDPIDQEIAAVIASSFAYGNVNIILRTLEGVFAALGPSPRRFVEQFDPRRGLRLFAGFRHRFNNGHDLCALIWGMRQMINQAGSIHAFFLRGHDPVDADMSRSLNRYALAALALDYNGVFGSSVIPEDSYFRFLFPAPSSGSACKRLCMMLRWLVRPADGIDLGIWGGLSPAQLIIPVDTHISRISRYLGLTGRTTADWRAAIEITQALRVYDPLDPVKYDFSLAHIGISNGCNGKIPGHCMTCQIVGICKHSTTK